MNNVKRPGIDYLQNGFNQIADSNNTLACMVLARDALANITKAKEEKQNTFDTNSDRTPIVTAEDIIGAIAADKREFIPKINENEEMER